MLPIDYRYVEPTDAHAVERIIREGAFKKWLPSTVILGQIGDRGLKRPSITEFDCAMADGLKATFRAESFGIEAMFSPVPLEQHAKRQFAAYLFSATLGLNIVPICAIREHPNFGLGSLTAQVYAWPFLHTREGQTIIRMGRPEDRIPYAEALLFERIIGAGQRLESSLLRDRHRRILSQNHQEAFSDTENGRLEVAFVRAGETISMDFWEALNGSGKFAMRWARLERILPDLIGGEATDMCLSTLNSVVREKKVGRCNIYIADANL